MSTFDRGLFKWFNVDLYNNCYFFFFYFENIDCPIKVGRTALVREVNRNVAVVNNCPNMIKENIFIFSFSLFYPLVTAVRSYAEGNSLFEVTNAIG